MADNKGTSIKNSAHVSEIKDTHKVPVSDGTGTPKHITLGDLKVTPNISIDTEELTDEYLNLEIGIVHKDPKGNRIKASYDQYKLESATPTAAGLMSASDKQKLDEMEGGGDLLVPITYSELKALRDQSKLVKGTQYRITDYDCSIAETDEVISAHHPFDIIVFADSENTLNENARAIQHDGDTYFNGQNLEKWELKYNIDNIGEYGLVSEQGQRIIIFDIAHNSCYGKLTINDTTYEGFPYKISDVKIGASICTIYLDGITDGCAGIIEYETHQEYIPNGDISNFRFADEIDGQLITFCLENAMYIIGTITENDTTHEGFPYKIEFYIIGMELKYFLFVDKLSDDCSGIMQYADDQELPEGIDYIEEELPSGVLSDFQLIPKGDEEEDEVVDNGGHGYITFLRDDKDNYAYYDFKNIKFARYRVKDNGNTGIFATSLLYGKENKDATIKPEKPYVTYDMDDKIFMYTFDYNGTDGSFLDSCHSNHIGRDSFDNVFYYSSTPTLENKMYGNTLGRSCYGNTLGNECLYNMLGDSCYGNTLGDFCQDNILDNTCFNNTLGNNCVSNQLLIYCQNNELGEGCQSNIFVIICELIKLERGCRSNEFGEYCAYITLGRNCQSNKFESTYTYITLGDGCYRNIFNPYLSNITYESRCSSNTISCAETTSIYKGICQNVRVSAGVNFKDIVIPTANNDFLTIVTNEDITIIDSDGNELGFTSTYKQKVDDMYSQLNGLGDLLNEVAYNINSL